MQVDNRTNKLLAYQITSKPQNMADNKISNAFLSDSYLATNTSVFIVLLFMAYFLNPQQNTHFNIIF